MRSLEENEESFGDIYFGELANSLPISFFAYVFYIFYAYLGENYIPLKERSYILVSLPILKKQLTA